MNFLKRIWRKMFNSTGVCDSHDTDLRELSLRASLTSQWPIKGPSFVYDPSTDEEKILRGEVESYFE